MSLDEFKEELTGLFAKKEIKVAEEILPHIAILTYDSNYTQVIYDYGIDVTLVILEILEKEQVYKECAKLTKAIRDHNKLESTEFPTNYK